MAKPSPCLYSRISYQLYANNSTVYILTSKRKKCYNDLLCKKQPQDLASWNKQKCPRQIHQSAIWAWLSCTDSAGLSLDTRAAAGPMVSHREGIAPAHPWPHLPTHKFRIGAWCWLDLSLSVLSAQGDYLSVLRGTLRVLRHLKRSSQQKLVDIHKWEQRLLTQVF